MSEFDYNPDDEPLIGDDEILFGSSSQREKAAPEKRLSSPITIGLIERLLAYTRKYANNDQPGVYTLDPRLIPTVISRVQSQDSENFSNILPALKQFLNILLEINDVPDILDAYSYPSMFDHHDTRDDFIEEDLDTASRIYDRVVDAYMTWIRDVVKKEEVERVRSKLKIIQATDIIPHVLSSARSSAYWSRVVDRYRNSDRYTQHPRIIKTDRLDITFGDGFAIFRCKFHHRVQGWKIATYEQLQMIQDATLSRHNVFTALATNLHNGTDHLYKMVCELFEWHNTCLTSYGNDGYELIKAPEALYKTHLTRLTKGDILDYSAFDRSVDKLRLKELAMNDCTPVVDSLLLLINKCTDIGDAVELFGLIKVSGHPTVYAEKSARSVRTEALPTDPSRPLTVLRALRMFKHMVLSAYVNKHAEWPQFEERPAPDTALRRLFLNRVTTLPLYSYPLSDLDHIKFGKFLEFDYSDDFLKFLDDKSISVGADHVWTFWWSSQDRPHRRLLLEALSKPKIDMHAIVERLRQGHFTRNEEVIELTQKERELKNAARCFCKMVLEVRCFFVLTEYNLGEYFMTPYMPQQTMTMSDAETKNRLYNMSFRTKEKKTAIAEVDFSRWNLRWRRSMIDNIARVCEDIFGLPGVFSQFHRFCTRSTLVLTDKHALPQGAKPRTSVHTWPEGDLLWRGRHLGGLEGIQQKIWTIATIVMLYLVFQGISCSFLMAGQGDNQVFVIRFGSSENVGGQLTHFLARMEIVCSQLNQEVKPEECIDSYTVLTYSKEIYVEGVHRQYSLKFLSRTMAVHDSDIPSLSAEVSAIGSTSLAVAGTLPIPLQGHFWQTFRTIRLFREHVRFSSNPDVSGLLKRYLREKGLLRFVLLLPGSLGGLPIMSWGRYIMRGEVDELSWDIASTLRISDVKPLLSDFHFLLLRKYTPERPNIESLLQDPMSIPLRRPADQVRLIREHLERALPRITKNTWLHEIVSNSVSRPAQELIRALCSTKPFHPAIMSDIYKHTLPGLRQDIYGRFNMTRTISSAVGGLKFAREISAASATLLGWIITRYRDALATNQLYQLPPTHTFEYACRLRAFWGVSSGEQLGTTYIPLSVNPTRNISDAPGITACTRTPLSQITTTVGEYPPNFGTKTKQKVSQHGYKIVTSSDTIKSLKHLVTTCSQLAAGPQLRMIIDSIIKSRSPWSLAQLEPVFPSVYGGVAAHRHEKIRNKLLGILGNLTPPTHICLSADNTGVLSGGQEDYAIVFQEYYLSAINTAQILAAALNSNRYFALRYPVPDVQPLSPERVEATITPNDVGTVSSDNALAYARHMNVKRLSVAPPSDIVPKRTRPGSKAVIIASYLLGKHNIKTDSTVNPDALATQAVEWFDVAEINNLTLEELVRGMAIACCIETVYHTLRTGLAVQVITKHSILYYTARCYCGGISRSLMIHNSPLRPELQAEGLLPPLGSKSATYLTKRLAGKVANLAEKLLTSGYIATSLTPFILFTDTTNNGLNLCRKLACYYLAYPVSADKSRIHFPRGLRRTVFDCFYVTRDTSNPLDTLQYGIGIVRAALDELRNGTNRTVRHRAELAQGTWPPLVWDNRDLDEAKRDIRDMPTYRAPPRPSIGGLSRTLLNGGVQVRKGNSLISNYSRNAAPLLRTQSRMSRRVQYLDHLFRPIGVKSSSVSIWHFALSHYQERLEGASVLSVGVGNGAVARACQTYGSKHVYGLDLRTSLPVNTQRETNHVPAEITDPARFSWVSEMYLDADVWFTRRRAALIDHYRPDAIILDTEGELSETILSIMEISCDLVLVRTFTSLNNLKSLMESGKFIRAVNLAAVLPSDPNVSTPVLLEVDTNNTAGVKTDCHSLEITRTPLRAFLKRNKEDHLVRLRIAAYPFSEHIKTGNLQEVESVILEMRRLENNTPHVAHWAYTSESRKTLELFQSVRNLNFEMAWRALQQAPIPTMRSVNLLLANCWPDLDQFLVYATSHMSDVI